MKGATSGAGIANPSIAHLVVFQCSLCPPLSVFSVVLLRFATSSDCTFGTYYQTQKYLEKFELL